MSSEKRLLRKVELEVKVFRCTADTSTVINFDLKTVGSSELSHSLLSIPQSDDAFTPEETL